MDIGNMQIEKEHPPVEVGKPTSTLERGIRKQVPTIQGQAPVDRGEKFKLTSTALKSTS